MVARSASRNGSNNLVEKLAARLKEPAALDEPFIIEDRIPQTRSRHVLVIWDAWRSRDRTARSTVIMDAFEAAGVLKGDTIRMALGLTQQEALDMGYLPFKIVPTHRKTDRATLGQLRKALNSVGGIHIRTGASHELRFPSQGHAEEAYRQLTAKLPGPYWAIVQEVASD
jgi:hypothetical protein